MMSETISTPNSAAVAENTSELIQIGAIVNITNLFTVEDWCLNTMAVPNGSKENGSLWKFVFNNRRVEQINGREAETATFL